MKPWEGFFIQTCLFFSPFQYHVSGIIYTVYLASFHTLMK